MDDYSLLAEYLASLGISSEMCEKIKERYESAEDKEGLIDYILTYEMMVDSCVD